VSPNNNPQHDCDCHDHRIQCVEGSEHRNILHLAGAHSNSVVPLNFPISMTGGVSGLEKVYPEKLRLSTRSTPPLILSAKTHSRSPAPPLCSRNRDLSRHDCTHIGYTGFIVGLLAAVNLLRLLKSFPRGDNRLWDEWVDPRVPERTNEIIVMTELDSKTGIPNSARKIR
jgi:hypothetical protein